VSVAAITSVAVSVVLGASVIWLVRRSFVTRIDEIRGALDRVQSGVREGVALAPLAGDELDEVTSSFNGMVAQLAQREDDMRASRVRIVAVADEERRRMERDLHDGAQQYLSLMRLQVAAIKRAIKQGSQPVTEQLDELSTTVDKALAELRNLAHGIYPATLETEGIRSALEEAARRAVLPTVVDGDDLPRLARESEAAIYFCCLEALQNAGKHAGPDATATLTLRAVDHRIEFEVADTGVGFDPEERPSSGLTNMSDRIGAIGGHVSVSSTRGAGTVVRGWAPASPAAG
jgi:signal transduction histidine kinase